MAYQAANAGVPVEILPTPFGDILRTYDYPVLPGYVDWRAARNAECHVDQQLEADKALAAGNGQEKRDASTQGRLPA